MGSPTPSQKLASSLPISFATSSNSSSSAVYTSLGCSKQTLMEATSTTVKGENGVIAEILACLAQGSIAWFQEQQASGSTAPVAHIGNSFTYLSQSPSLGFLILVPPITSRVTNPYSLNFSFYLQLFTKSYLILANYFAISHLKSYQQMHCLVKIYYQNPQKNKRLLTVETVK